MNIDIRDSTEWPSCNSCGQRHMVVGGGFFACCECEAFGMDSKSESQIKTLGMAKLACRLDGSGGILQFCGHRPDESEIERSVERASMVGCSIYMHHRLRQAMASLCERKSFAPTALIYDRHNEEPYVMDMRMDRAEARIAARSLKAETVIILQVEGETMTAEMHIYNQPTRKWAIPFELFAGEILFDWKDLKLVPTASSSLIWQPIDWSIIQAIPYRIQPKYLGCIEIKNDVNITFAIHEDMDGPTSMQISFRTPWSVDKSEIKNYDVVCAEEALQLMDEKFNKARASAAESGEIVIQEECLLNSDEHAWNSLLAIRTQRFWDLYQSLR